MINKERQELMVQRTPRIVPSYLVGDVEIETPPSKSSKPAVSWLNMLFPPIAMMMMSILTSVVMKSRKIIFSVVGMTIVTILVALLSYFVSLRKHAKSENEKKLKYRQYSISLVQALQNANVKQREVMHLVHPSIESCIEITSSLGKALWERTSIETDFLHTRLGIGTQLLQMKTIFPEMNKSTGEENILLTELKKQCEPVNQVSGIPFAIPFREIGLLGLVGKREKLRELINAIVIHLSTHHGYDEVKTVFVYPPEEQLEWEWLRWLPHVWNDDRSVKYMASTPYDVLQITEDLQQQLKARESRKNGYSEASNQNRLPHYVFFVLNPELLENLDFFSYLLSTQSSLGLTSIFLSERVDLDLPLNCQTIIEAVNKEGYVRRDLTNSLKEYGRTFEPDYVSKVKAEQFARYLSPIKLKETGGKNKIPLLVTFLEIFQVDEVADLQIMKRWNINQADRSLGVPLGKASGGKLFIFDMHERSYGPHGLVAGTTGSGKSELLQSLILALAVNYHPHEVAMVLVDYKGGGMANAFRGLPHLVGTITNLGGNEISRSLVSIKSELKRRQLLFGQIGVNSIDAYMVNYREGLAKEPLPHLIIIVDEFAELKSDQPEFMVELISAARVGRSLGIHLVLATQKPSGVVNDQIWSNSKFKLCLKVQDISDSQEMLKRPEAADIKERGRGYLQVGNNELFSLFQSAWSGAPYEIKKQKSSVPVVFKVDKNGNRTQIGSKDVDQPQSEKPSTQLDAVVSHIIKEAKEKGIKPVQPLWLDPLPERIALEECGLLYNQVGEKLKAVSSVDGLVVTIGIVDHPAAQSQFALQLDLGKEGHLLIYGAPNSGKTTLIKSMMTSLAASYTADDLHMYVLDYGSRTLAVFHELPQLGDVVYLEDEDKLIKLLKMLAEELDERKRLFATVGVGNIFAYRQITATKIPAIMVFIDNFTAYSENYNDYVGQLVTFIREGGNYGVHLILTGTTSNAFSYKITQNVRQVITLQMADKSDYYSLVGRTNVEPLNVPGRGLVKLDVPLEFHTALPNFGANDEEMTQGIRTMGKQLNEGWQGKRARKIPTIPKKLSVQELMNRFAQNDENQMELDGPAPFPIGLDLESTFPVALKSKDFFSCVFSYTDDVQNQQMMHAWIQIWNKLFITHHLKIHVIEGAVSSLQKLKKSGEIESYVTSEEEVQACINQVIDELQNRKNAAREAAANLDDPETFNEIKFIHDHYPMQLICMPSLQESASLLNDEVKQNLERMARYGKGLGIYMFVSSLAGDLNRLKNSFNFLSALIEQKNAILTGGTLQQHTAFNQELMSISYSEQNREIGEDIGWLIRQNQKTKIKLVSNYE